MAEGIDGPSVTPVARNGRPDKTKEIQMNAYTMYELAKLRIADDVREADQARLARLARPARRPRSVSIDAARYRQRILRVFGLGGPANSPAGA